MSLLDRLLAPGLRRPQAPAPDPHAPDPWERSAAYPGWPWPLRTLLALRYLAHKRQALRHFRLHGRYPVPPAAFRDQVLRQLGEAPPPRWRHLLRSAVFYPLLLALAGTAGLLAWQQATTRQLERLLADDLVRYADLLHRGIAPRVQGQTEATKALDLEVAALRAKLIAGVPDRGEVRKRLAEALDALRAPDPAAIRARFGALNRALTDQHLPYYLLPQTYVGDCAAFLGDSMLAQLLLAALRDGADAADAPAQTCQTTAVLVYRIAGRQDYAHAGRPLPLFQASRLDRLPIAETALGLTAYDGPGSLILTDNIRAHALTGILPALDSRGRDLVLPLWLDGSWRVRNQVIEAYNETLLHRVYRDQPTAQGLLRQTARDLLNYREYLERARFRLSLLRADYDAVPSGDDQFLGGLDALSLLLADGKPPIPAPPVLQSPPTATLERLLERSVAYHEAWHQVRDTPGWTWPAWGETVLADLPADLRERTLDETGAYLAEIAYADRVELLRLSSLLFFATDRLLDNTAEFHAARLLLPALRDAADPPLLPVMAGNPLELVEAYTALRERAQAEPGFLAQRACRTYANMFGAPLPAMAPRAGPHPDPCASLRGAMQ